MLSEQAKLLLSAHVDGVLSKQHADAAEKLLRESSLARALVKSLRENIEKVKTLPRRSLGAGFPAQVLANLPDNATIPAFESDGEVVRKPQLRRSLPAWAVGGIAACLVGVVTLGSVVWLRGQVDVDRTLLPANSEPVVRNEKPPVRNPVVDQLVQQAMRGSAEGYGENKVKPVRPVTSEKPKIDYVQYSFGDLQRDDSFNALKRHLAASGGVHLDVTVRYNRRSLDRVIESLSKQGVQLVVTPPAESSIAKKQPLLVYAENVPADKLAAALKELGEVDVAGKNKEASTFAAVRVTPESADDYTRFSQSLGIDAKQLKSPSTRVPQVSSLGVVLPAERLGDPAAMNEVRAFLAARGPVQIGALQVFLHLQPTEK